MYIHTYTCIHTYIHTYIPVYLYTYIEYIAEYIGTPPIGHVGVQIYRYRYMNKYIYTHYIYNI